LGVGGPLACDLFKRLVDSKNSMTQPHTVGLVRPIRGWNSWDSYCASLDQTAALANARVMAKKLLPYGYDYFCVDGGWMGEHGPNANGNTGLHIDSFGRCLPSRSHFPDGLKALAASVHALGLKFGLHLMRGVPRIVVERNLPVLGTSVFARDIADLRSTCSWSTMCYGVNVFVPQGQTYYDGVIDLIASWNVDLLKVDDIVPHPPEIAAIAKAIARQQRDIRLCLSPGNVLEYGKLGAYEAACTVRLTPDAWDRRADLERAFDALRDFTVAVAARGIVTHLRPDLDMLPFGQLMIPYPAPTTPLGPDQRPPYEGYARQSLLNLDQKRSYITLRALAGSPLLMGGALVDLTDQDLRLLTQPDLIACHDNGVVAERFEKQPPMEIWRVSSKTAPVTWVGVFNRSTTHSEFKLSLRHLGLQTPGPVYDIWNERPLEWIDSHIVVRLPADAVAFLRV